MTMKYVSFQNPTTGLLTETGVTVVEMSEAGYTAREIATEVKSHKDSIHKFLNRLRTQQKQDALFLAQFRGTGLEPEDMVHAPTRRKYEQAIARETQVKSTPAGPSRVYNKRLSEGTNRSSFFTDRNIEPDFKD